MWYAIAVIVDSNDHGDVYVEQARSEDQAVHIVSMMMDYDGNNGGNDDDCDYFISQ